MDEDDEWVRRIPNPTGEHGVVEIRRCRGRRLFGRGVHAELTVEEEEAAARTDGSGRVARPWRVAT